MFDLQRNYPNFENFRREENVAEQEISAAEKKPQRVFVDFGAGRHPVAGADWEKFRDNYTYVAIDYDPEELKFGKNDLLEKIGYIPENVLFVQSNGKNIPLQSNSVDEIYFGNVFGEPFRKEFKKKKEPELISERKTIIDIRNFVSEAGRILKDNGLIVILETYTPTDSSENDLKKTLESAGFVIEKRIGAEDPGFVTEWRKYDSFHEHFSRKGEGIGGESYILYARKKKEK